MQQELEDNFPDLPIHLLAINADGHESGNDDAALVATLPLLQDNETAAVWHNWAASWRDVYVVDGNNEVVWTVNLTDHSLGDDEFYAELLTVLVETADDL